MPSFQKCLTQLKRRSESGPCFFDSSFHQSLRQTLSTCSDSIRSMSLSLLLRSYDDLSTQQFALGIFKFLYRVILEGK